MKKINLLYLINELLITILISILTTVELVVLSILVLIEYITEGLKSGFRRIIT